MMWVYVEFENGDWRFMKLDAVRTLGDKLIICGGGEMLVLLRDKVKMLYAMPEALAPSVVVPKLSEWLEGEDDDEGRVD